MDAAQLRRHIVRPSLELLEAWSPAAEALVMGTAAQESRLRYVHQLGDGPALGLWQMEPATYRDIWENYLAYRPALARRICIISDTGPGRPPASRLVWDLQLGAIMCRVHYRRRPEPLPDPADVWALAAYWKQHYNTPQGKGTEAEFVRHFSLVAETGGHKHG